jgi:hypothetical protein
MKIESVIQEQIHIFIDLFLVPFIHVLVPLQRRHPDEDINTSATIIPSVEILDTIT